MAHRPVFIPTEADHLVEQIDVEFEWFPGFSVAQKQRSARSLHRAAADVGYEQLLEVSSKSWDRLGVQLSAFNLETDVDGLRVPVEVAFQASKVYDSGGPFHDLLGKSAREARKDPRHDSSGRLVGFEMSGERWLTSDGTLFYDSLYLRALSSSDLEVLLRSFDGFTDIEFNPARSLNCQARSCALFVSLARRGVLDAATHDRRQLRDLCSKYVAVTLATNSSVGSRPQTQLDL